MPKSHSIKKEDKASETELKAPETPKKIQDDTKIIAEETPALSTPVQTAFTVVDQEEDIINDSAAVEVSSRSIPRGMIPHQAEEKEENHEEPQEIITQVTNPILMDIESDRKMEGVSIDIQDSEPFPFTQPSNIPLKRLVEKEKIPKKSKVLKIVEETTYDNEWEDRWL